MRVYFFFFAKLHEAKRNLWIPVILGSHKLLFWTTFSGSAALRIERHLTLPVLAVSPAVTPVTACPSNSLVETGRDSPVGTTRDSPRERTVP